MSGPFLRLPGVVCKGYGVASGAAADSRVPGGTIAAQVPFFAERGLDLSAFYPGTLNVSVQPKTLNMVRPRYTFRRVGWLPGHSEDFSFSPCGLVFGGRDYQALIYYPHPETKLGHPHPPWLVEVLAPLVAGIGYGSAVELQVDPEEVSLHDLPGDGDSWSGIP